jgi:hypothetical protein
MPTPRYATQQRLYFLQGAEQWGVDLAVGVEIINGVQLP